MPMIGPRRLDRVGNGGYFYKSCNVRKTDDFEQPAQVISTEWGRWPKDPVAFAKGSRYLYDNLARATQRPQDVICNICGQPNYGLAILTF